MVRPSHGSDDHIVLQGVEVGVGGGTPLYGMCRPAPSGRVFALFWSENEYTLCPFWSAIRYGFLRELRDCMNVFIVSIPNKSERKNNIYEFEMDLKNFFVCALI